MKKYTEEWWASLPPEKVGKETEGIVESLFRQWNTSQRFAWHRMPDAKAARGRMAAQPADYIYRHGMTAGFIEVKALKHPYRLPNARVSQLPTLHKWGLAGSSDFILVFHYMEGLWRVVKATDLEAGQPSWDLRGVSVHPSPEAALLSTGLFYG